MSEAIPERLYISADELLSDSFKLALKVLDSGFRPTHIIGIWRGGTPVGIAVQELLDFSGIKTDHIRQVIADIRADCRKNTPDIRIATIYYKPGNSEPSKVPHYYLHETAHWLVFPHELTGLSVDELLERKPGIERIRERLRALHAGKH